MYWWVLAILWLCYLTAKSASIFEAVGHFGLLPLAFAAWVALSLLWRNIFNGKTTDEYVDSGNFAQDFNNLPAEKKVEMTMRQIQSYLIGAAIIIHALFSRGG